METKKELQPVKNVLSESEKELLAMFDQLNDYGKHTALSVIYGMSLNSEFVSQSKKEYRCQFRLVK